MKAQPKKGDVIRIRGSNPVLVINANMVKEYDGARNDTVPYACYQFVTIPLPTRDGLVNPTEKTWTLTGGSMSGPNLIDLEKIEKVARVTVFKYVETRYTLNEKDLGVIAQKGLAK